LPVGLVLKYRPTGGPQLSFDGMAGVRLDDDAKAAGVGAKKRLCQLKNSR
jgi:hypothetical protein